MKWLNWINLVLGVWVLISPWVLGFSALSIALWSNVIVGILLIVLAVWQLFGAGMNSANSSSNNSNNVSGSSMTQ